MRCAPSQTAFTLWERLNKYKPDPCTYKTHTKIVHLAPESHEHENDVLKG